MSYFVISNSNGAKAAENYFNAKGLGTYVNGIGSYEANGETFSGIYYLEGIKEFDLFLEGLKMYEQYAIIEMLYYTNFELVFLLNNKKSSVIVSIPNKEIDAVIVYPNTSDYERGRLLISGTGLIGLLGREISKKYIKTKPDLVSGIKFSFFFNDDSKISFFAPLMAAAAVMPFLNKHFEQKVKVYS